MWWPGHSNRRFSPREARGAGRRPRPNRGLVGGTIQGVRCGFHRPVPFGRRISTPASPQVLFWRPQPASEPAADFYSTYKDGPPPNSAPTHPVRRVRIRVQVNRIPKKTKILSRFGLTRPRNSLKFFPCPWRRALNEAESDDEAAQRSVP